MSAAAYEHDADGSKFIPATQRPDGTWRKPRRIKDGYVPQEEVPLYESKGKQFKARQNTGLPVGLTPEIVAEAQKSRKSQGGSNQALPGMLNTDKKKKKKKSGAEEVTEKLAKCEITEPKFNSPSSSSLSSNSAQTDPLKRLKNLRKKLRDIETLEEKIKAGGVLDKDQKEKMSKRNDIISEIYELENENIE